MKKILITGVTVEGNKALKDHWEESKTKLTFQQRLMFKVSGYKHELISEDPYTILVTINNRHSDNPLFIDLMKGEIIKALKDNGAKGIDYNIEVS
jgi:hypothetical protein